MCKKKCYYLFTMENKDLATIAKGQEIWMDAWDIVAQERWVYNDAVELLADRNLLADRDSALPYDPSTKKYKVNSIMDQIMPVPAHSYA